MTPFDLFLYIAAAGGGIIVFGLCFVLMVVLGAAILGWVRHASGTDKTA